MKKTYIAPSTEIEMTQVQALMAVSLNVTNGESGDVADSRNFIWEDDAIEE